MTAVAAPPRRRTPAPVRSTGPGPAATPASGSAPWPALWSSLLLVTYWWAAGGGIQDLGGWATGLTSIGRLTGLVASDLLLVQVLLMARLPAARARVRPGPAGPRCTGWSASPRST